MNDSNSHSSWHLIIKKMEVNEKIVEQQRSMLYQIKTCNIRGII